MAITGQCLCGDIQYQFNNPPKMTGVCHCKNCQRQAGSAFSTLAALAKDDFTITKGEPKLYTDLDTRSGNSVERWFCGKCGSPIYSFLPGQPDAIYLKTGTLDDTESFTPMFHVWCETKQSWVDLDDNVPQMAQQT